MPDTHSWKRKGLFGVNIYTLTTSQTTVGGSVSSTTLNVRGGLLRQFLIRANTSTTIFRADITEQNGIAVLNYGYHTGEINDTGASGALPLPMSGYYNLNITNASPNDTFNIRLSLQE